MEDHIIDFEKERQRRSKFTIVLAAGIYHLIHDDPEDPTPISESINELYGDLLTLSDDELESDYRHEVAARVALGDLKNRGFSTVLVDLSIDLEPYHQESVTLAHEYLDKIQRDFGVSPKKIISKYMQNTYERRNF